MNHKLLSLSSICLLSLNAIAYQAPVADLGAPKLPGVELESPAQQVPPPRSQPRYNMGYVSNSAYFNGNVGYGYVNADTNKYDKSRDYDVSRTDFAWSINLGYQLNEAAAVELGYMSMPGSKIKNRSTDLVDKHEIKATTLMFKGSMPMSNEQDVFGKIGVAAMKDSPRIYDNNGNSVHSDKSYGSVTTAIFGVGMDIHTQQNLDLTLQMLFTPSKENKMPGTATALIGFNFRLA